MSLPQGWALKSFEDDNSVTGRKFTYEYEGPMGASEATLNTFLGQLAAGAARTVINKNAWNSNGHGIAKVVVEYAVTSTGSIPSTSDADYGLIKRLWTKHTNVIQKPLLSHPTVAPLYSVLPTGWSSYGGVGQWPGSIKQTADRYTDMLKDLAEGTSTTVPDPVAMLATVVPAGHTPTPDELNIVGWLFSEYVNDPNATWEYGQPVLRKTEIVTNYTKLKAVHEDVEKIYAWSKLSSVESSLSLALIVNAADLDDWYWVKKSPEVEESSNGTFQIVQEYWGTEVITPMTIMRYGEPIS